MIFFKKASKDFQFSPRKLLANISLIKGLSLYILATVLFIPALRFGELSVLYPIMALTYLWSTLLSIKYLKENMNSYKWIALILIIIGVIFIGLGSG